MEKNETQSNYSPDYYGSRVRLNSGRGRTGWIEALRTKQEN